MNRTKCLDGTLSRFEPVYNDSYSATGRDRYPE